MHAWLASCLGEVYPNCNVQMKQNATWAILQCQVSNLFGILLQIYSNSFHVIPKAIAYSWLSIMEALLSPPTNLIILEIITNGKKLVENWTTYTSGDAKIKPRMELQIQFPSKSIRPLLHG